VDAAVRARVGRERAWHGTAIDALSLQSTIEWFGSDEFEPCKRAPLELTGDEALGLHLLERASEACFDLVARLVARALRPVVLCLSEQRYPQIAAQLQ